MLGLAPTSAAESEILALRALLLIVLEVGTAFTSAAEGVHVLGRAPTSLAVYVGLVDAFAQLYTSEAGIEVGKSVISDLVCL